MTANVARSLGAVLIVAGLAVPAWSADQSDPDWPCIQRKVPTLSAGQMWPGDPAVGDWRADPDLARLASLMAARRTSLDEVKAIAQEYAGDLESGERKARMALLFLGVLEQIDVERSDIMSGISRYAHRQVGLSDSVKQEEQALAAMRAEPNTDLDKVEEAQDKLNWDIRIFRERSQSLTYVCETPVLLEQRAFAIARLLAEIS